MKRKRKGLKIGLLIVIVLAAGLVAFRVYLPSLLKHYVNRTLDKIPGYKGRVDGINVEIWRGAYQIRGLELLKTDGKVPVPFFSAEWVDLGVEWRELFNRRLVGTIFIQSPQLNFVAGPTKEQSQTSIDESWQDRVQELFPVDINRFEIKNGSVHFRNFHASPNINVYLDQMDIVALNLSNTQQRYHRLLASIQAKARAMRHGQLNMKLDFNPFEDQPTFAFDGRLEGLNAIELNDFLRHYAGLEAKQGKVGVYTEFAADKGAFQGYVKPIIEDLTFDAGSKELTLGQKVKSVFAQMLTSILENKKKDTLATKVEFSGRFDDPKVNTWSAVRYVFRNGFIKALTPQLEQSINLKTIKK